MEVLTEIDLPKVLKNLPGCQWDLIVLVVSILARAVAVEAGVEGKLVGIVLFVGTETMHDQLWQGQ
ncbi:hypothetical protein D3C77_554940 [compost metagenome]